MNNWNQLRIEQFQLKAAEELTDSAEGWRFMRVSQGEAYWLDKSRSVALSEGEMLVVAPSKKGAFRASQLTDVVLHGFTFVPDLICGFFTLGERQCIENGQGEAARVLPSTHPISEQFAALIGRCPLDGGLAERTEIFCLTVAFFSNATLAQQLPTMRNATARARFEKMIPSMPDSELMHHAPEELARLCGCSQRYFGRMFIARFGMSALAKQTEVRLLRARWLLEGTDVTISQIAAESGFRNLRMLNSLFKKKFGHSPSAWRKRLANSSAHPAHPEALALPAGKEKVMNPRHLPLTNLDRKPAPKLAVHQLGGAVDSGVSLCGRPGHEK